MFQTKCIKPVMFQNEEYWAEAVWCEVYLTCVSSIRKTLSGAKIWLSEWQNSWENAGPFYFDRQIYITSYSRKPNCRKCQKIYRLGEKGICFVSMATHYYTLHIIRSVNVNETLLTPTNTLSSKQYSGRHHKKTVFWVWHNLTFCYQKKINNFRIVLIFFWK